MSEIIKKVVSICIIPAVVFFPLIVILFEIVGRINERKKEGE